MKTYLKICALIMFSASAGLYAQSAKVSTYLKMVAQGKMIEVKSKLPDLIAEYPDDPGVKLLHGVVIEDGSRALEIYKDIVKNYPDSEWADDAYWRVIQYYAVSGDAELAEKELENFRKKYPSSEFLAPATDVVHSAEQILRKKNISREIKDAAAEPETIAENRELPAMAAAYPEKSKKTAEGKASKNAPAGKNGKTAEPKSSESKAENDAEARYGLQVGLYSTKEKAAAEKSKFTQMRMRSAVEEKTVNGRVMYAVVVGDYSSRAMAESAKKVVEGQCKCEAIIYKK